VKEERTGIFTSGIVATDAGRKIALFFTGVRHAGENLNAVLARRSADLPPPIQMADGLSRNVPSDFDTILGSCLAHARRKHVELVESFPEQVRCVLETLREVYITDARARKDSLDPQQRLKLHQEESQPRMAALEQWMQTQFTERIVEPNSSFGSAILYMQKRWPQLTLFLRVAGAPLDSNIVERALKKAILHRKAAMFYKTLNGARVGDVFMSLIYTAELNDVPSFEYLVALLQHPDQVRVNPGDWMPWNYQQTLAHRKAGPAPPLRCDPHHRQRHRRDCAMIRSLPAGGSRMAARKKNAPLPNSMNCMSNSRTSSRVSGARSSCRAPSSYPSYTICCSS